VKAKADKSAYISDSFKRRADSSAFMEAWVGAKLSRYNLFTVHHPFTLTSETDNPASFYANTWDLDVSPNNVLFTPVEVKSINLRFTEPNDYPHMGVLVCSDKSFQNKWPGKETTQRDFLLVSRESGGIVWIPKGTETIVSQVTDKKRGETYACRATHKQYLRSLADFVNRIQGHADPWGEPNGEED
jgi:hypothetical protein